MIETPIATLAQDTETQRWSLHLQRRHHHAHHSPNRQTLPPNRRRNPTHSPLPSGAHHVTFPLTGSPKIHPLPRPDQPSQPPTTRLPRPLPRSHHRQRQPGSSTTFYPPLPQTPYRARSIRPREQRHRLPEKPAPLPRHRTIYRSTLCPTSSKK